VGQWLGQVMFPQGLYNLPIPEHRGPDDYDDRRFLQRAQTKLKWSLMPRRCHVSRRWIWLTLAYCADYIISGPGDPAVWTRWYSREEMVLLKLKGY
jgi:hypothetical protein